MGIWQIIYLAMMMLSLGVSLAEHGKPKEGRHSFWISFISLAIQITILYFGGFFS